MPYSQPKPADVPASAGFLYANEKACSSAGFLHVIPWEVFRNLQVTVFLPGAHVVPTS